MTNYNDITEENIVKFEGGFWKYDPHLLGNLFQQLHLKKVQSANKIKRLEQELKDLLDEKFLEHKYPVGINEKISDKVAEAKANTDEAVKTKKKEIQTAKDESAKHSSAYVGKEKKLDAMVEQNSNSRAEIKMGGI
jgi:hypothetical protein